MSDTPISQSTPEHINEAQKPENKIPAPDPAAKAAPEAKAAKPAEAATAVAEKPAAAEKPAEPAEKPFSTDVLQSCTARFTRKAWNIYLYYKKDGKIRTTPIRATLETRNPEAAEEMHRTLQEGGVKELSRKGNTLSMTATFEQIQLVIKHPGSKMLDAAEL